METAAYLNFDLSGLLHELYADEAHFIYELIQNAEDAGASSCEIEIDNGFVYFSHDAKRKFDDEDIRSVLAIGNSTKRRDKSKIGRFGIGIKSIFSHATGYEIHSGAYHIYIKDYVVPSIIEDIKNDGTLFVIHLKSVSESKIISKALKKMDARVLMFLNSIHSLRVRIDGKDLLDITKSSFEDGKISLQNTLLDSEPVFYKIHSGASGVKLSYAMSLQLTDTPLFCYFETAVLTGLPFYIHAPAETTPARDNVSFNDGCNKSLLESLLHLFADLLEKGKLPWHLTRINATRHLGGLFNQRLIDTLNRKQLIPTKYGGFARLSKSYACSIPEIYCLLPEELAPTLVRADIDLSHIMKEDRMIGAKEFIFLLNQRCPALPDPSSLIDWKRAYSTPLVAEEIIRSNFKLILAKKTNTLIKPSDLVHVIGEFSFSEREFLYEDEIRAFDFCGSSMEETQYIEKLFGGKRNTVFIPRDYPADIALIIKNESELPQRIKSAALFKCSDGVFRAGISIRSSPLHFKQAYPDFLTCHTPMLPAQLEAFGIREHIILDEIGKIQNLSSILSSMSRAESLVLAEEITSLTHLCEPDIMMLNQSAWIYYKGKPYKPCDVSMDMLSDKQYRNLSSPVYGLKFLTTAAMKERLIKLREEALDSLSDSQVAAEYKYISNMDESKPEIAKISEDPEAEGELSEEANMWYETLAMEYLKNLHESFGEEIFENDLGFSTSGGDLYIVEDRIQKGWEGWDVTHKLGGSVIEYIEIKGSKSGKYHLTRSQLKKAFETALRSESKYRLLLVSGGGVMDIPDLHMDLLYGRIVINPSYISVVEL
ncbi:MAG: ATP-binding protein [Clostridiales bacterium]|jgi:hypothetical protein|nr:ATP-binding protein [Clostridiales bacterium]